MNAKEIAELVADARTFDKFTQEQTGKGQTLYGRLADALEAATKDAEWEYGVEGRFAETDEHWESWEVSTYAEALATVERQMASEPEGEDAVNWLPVRRVAASAPGDWEPIPASENALISDKENEK